MTPIGNSALDTTGHRVESASLGTFDPDRGWAPRGQAWLALTVAGLGDPQPTGPDAVPPDGSLRFDPYGSFTLRLPDGTALPPAAAYPADGGELAVVFAVDDGTRSASFRAAPRWLLTVGDQAVGVGSTPVDVAVELG